MTSTSSSFLRRIDSESDQRSFKVGFAEIPNFVIKIKAVDIGDCRYFFHGLKRKPPPKERLSKGIYPMGGSSTPRQLMGFPLSFSLPHPIRAHAIFPQRHLKLFYPSSALFLFITRSTTYRFVICEMTSYVLSCRPHPRISIVTGS